MKTNTRTLNRSVYKCNSCFTLNWLCKGITIGSYRCTVNFTHSLICNQTDATPLFWIYLDWSCYCFYFSFLSGWVGAPEGLKPAWMKHNLMTARSSTVTCWNKHFSLDTCINSLLLKFKIQNAYFPFCLAFLEHLFLNLELHLLLRMLWRC